MGKLRYRAVFCDLDDTLLDDDMNISSKNIYTINRFIGFGGQFFIATARNFIGSKKYYELIHARTPIILMQGAYVFSPLDNSIIYKKAFARPELYKACLLLENMGIYFQLFSDTQIYVREKNEYSNTYIKNCGVIIHETNEELSSFVINNRIAIYKIMIECEERLTDNIFVVLCRNLGQCFNIERSKKWIIEITPKDVSKGDAVTYLMKHLGYSKSESMAIGNSKNDLSMFNAVEFSVSMHNSENSIKLKSSAVTLSNNRSGVSYAIKKYAIK